MLDVRRLEVLAAAVRERSLAAAARSLGITPSAASQAISALERQIGSPLLHRRARGVEPTPVGERLSLHAEAVLAQLAIAEAELSGTTPRVLRVGAFATAVRGLLAAAISDLRSTGAVLDLEVHELEPDDARVAMRAGIIEVALVNHDAELAPDIDGPWRVTHVLDEPVYVALPEAHRLASRARVDLRQLGSEAWIMQMPASPCQQLTYRACAAAGFAPAVSATCADYSSIIALVRAGHGVSIVPRLAAHRLDLTGVKLLPARTALTRRINALASTGEGVGSTMLVNALREVAVHRSAGDA
ncbi:MAG: LysR family transcriptional regulator [Ilumatobacteraceae bacterium]